MPFATVAGAENESPPSVDLTNRTSGHAMKKIIGFIADLLAPAAVAAALVEVGYVSGVVLSRGAPAR